MRVNGRITGLAEARAAGKHNAPGSPPVGHVVAGEPNHGYAYTRVFLSNVSPVESHRTQMLPSEEVIQRLRPLALEVLRARAHTRPGGAAGAAGAASLVPQVGGGGGFVVDL